MLNRGDSGTLLIGVRALQSAEQRIIEGQKIGETPNEDMIRASLLVARDRINDVLNKINHVHVWVNRFDGTDYTHSCECGAGGEGPAY